MAPPSPSPSARSGDGRPLALQIRFFWDDGLLKTALYPKPERVFVGSTPRCELAVEAEDLGADEFELVSPDARGFAVRVGREMNGQRIRGGAVAALSEGRHALAPGDRLIVSFAGMKAELELIPSMEEPPAVSRWPFDPLFAAVLLVTLACGAAFLRWLSQRPLIRPDPRELERRAIRYLPEQPEAQLRRPPDQEPVVSGDSNRRLRSPPGDYLPASTLLAVPETAVRAWAPADEPLPMPSPSPGPMPVFAVSLDAAPSPFAPERHVLVVVLKPWSARPPPARFPLPDELQHAPAPFRAEGDPEAAARLSRLGAAAHLASPEACSLPRQGSGRWFSALQLSAAESWLDARLPESGEPREAPCLGDLLFHADSLLAAREAGGIDRVADGAAACLEFSPRAVRSARLLAVAHSGGLAALYEVELDRAAAATGPLADVHLVARRPGQAEAERLALRFGPDALHPSLRSSPTEFRLLVGHLGAVGIAASPRCFAGWNLDEALALACADERASDARSTLCEWLRGPRPR